MSSHPIHWPAVIQYRGDDELRFIASRSHWAEYCRAPDLHSNDRLIDALGAVYQLDLAAGSLGLLQTDDRVSLNEVLDLVRAHAAVHNQCCVAKLGARSISEVIHLVEHISD
jgi:hypothetical protein